jgi:hypothetical protein
MAMPARPARYYSLNYTLCETTSIVAYITFHDGFCTTDSMPCRYTEVRSATPKKLLKTKFVIVFDIALKPRLTNSPGDPGLTVGEFAESGLLWQR